MAACRAAPSWPPPGATTSGKEVFYPDESDETVIIEHGHIDGTVVTVGTGEPPPDLTDTLGGTSPGDAGGHVGLGAGWRCFAEGNVSLHGGSERFRDSGTLRLRRRSECEANEGGRSGAALSAETMEGPLRS